MTTYSVYFKSLVTILACCVFCALLAIPLMLRKIPRNFAYGFRTRATMENDAVWYDVNAFFGRAFFIANFSAALLMVAMYGFKSHIAPGVFLCIGVATLVAPSLISILVTSRHMRNLGGRA